MSRTPSGLACVVATLLACLLSLAGASPAAALADDPVSATAGGRTYYLDAVSGRDSYSGTSPTAAWRTLARASAASFAPGDRLLLHEGDSWTGKLEISRSGTADLPITVSSYGAGTSPLIDAGDCVSVLGSYVVVRDLDIRNCSFAGVSVSGDHDIVAYDVVTDNVAGVFIREESTAARVFSNEIRRNNRMSVLTASPDNDDSGAFGVLVQGDGAKIALNTITGSDAFSYDYGRDGSAVEIYGARHTYVHHNEALQNDAFSELGNARTADTTYSYNVVRSSLEASIFLVTRGAGSSYGPVLGTDAFNNTAYLTGALSQGVVCHAGCGPDILKMRNNIVQATLKAGYADAPFDEDYDLFFGGVARFRLGPHSFFGDPLFSAPDAADVRLSADSPAIDRGVDVGLDLDHRGLPVPADGEGDGIPEVDLGAYERRGD
jgi:hypothetical protein